MLKFARVCVVDVVGGGGEGGVGVEFDVSAVDVAVFFDEFGRIGLGGLVERDNLAERDGSEATLDVFLHGSVDVAGVFGGADEIFVNVVLVVVRC